MEVLAPAGGWEALKAAVFAGADAVYLGGSAFGARAHAKNFTDEELREAVRFCHARGVRVHVTVNTLYKDGELPLVLRFVSFLCSLPVDAVLVQDMGLFSLLRERAPELPIHASTQMSLHTPQGVRLLWEQGASRVVLSRELSLEEIREIRKACPVELEAFVHGALCMSVSGQCYLSAMLGGRSGNRGMCAQPCRLPFAAPGGTGYDLSLKDLSFIPEAKQLEQVGICSLKIEGRMKRPEYVAAATAACRRTADGEQAPQELLRDLEAVFSRSGFTKGYLTGRLGSSMFGIRTKEDVTGATKQVFSALRGLYRGERQSVPLLMKLTREDGGLRLLAEDGEGRKARSDLFPEEEDRPALSPERCVEQLSKTGGTPFFVKKAAAPKEGARLGVSALNAARRKVLEELLIQREQRAPIPFSELPLPIPEGRAERREALSFRACFRSPKQLCPQAGGCQEWAFPLFTDLQELERLGDQGSPKILLEIPRAMFGAEERVRARMKEAMDRGFSEFVCGNLGAVALCRELGAVCHGSFSLNITNTFSLEYFRTLGLSTAELSFELTEGEISSLGGALSRGLMIYGRQGLMLTRNCPLANSPKGCLKCASPGFLTDRMKKRFPVMCQLGLRGSCAEVYNSVPLWLGDITPAGVDFGVLRFTVENSVECGQVLDFLFRQKPFDFAYTRGLFRRGVE